MYRFVCCRSHIFAAMADLPPATHRPHALYPVAFAGAPPPLAHNSRPYCIAQIASYGAPHAPRASHVSMLPSRAAKQPACAPCAPPRPHLCCLSSGGATAPQRVVRSCPALRTPLAADHHPGLCEHVDFTKHPMRRSWHGWLFALNVDFCEQMCHESGVG